MGFDTAYEAINEGEDAGHRWAYGTGFTDPLSGVDTTLPAGVDGADLATYCLMLGDDALVMSHRLQQWLAHAPELEEETALANIALDLLGQARLLLSRAGAADGSGRTEDDYAFGRTEREFRSVRLAEVIDADFAGLIARLLAFMTDSARPSTRYSPRSPRRASGRSPTTGTTQGSGWSGSATVPTTRASGWRPAWRRWHP
jgi:ring-1,2-phenylacetyl-CoA epoxidase subunit PaaC